MRYKGKERDKRHKEEFSPQGWKCCAPLPAESSFTDSSQRPAPADPASMPGVFKPRKIEDGGKNSKCESLIWANSMCSGVRGQLSNASSIKNGAIGMRLRGVSVGRKRRKRKNRQGARHVRSFATANTVYCFKNAVGGKASRKSSVFPLEAL